MNSLGQEVASQLVADGYDVAIVNPRFIKPIDSAATELFGRAADVVVTLEDHILAGGYGAGILEFFNEKRIATPVVRIGWPDQFIEHASTVEDLRAKYGLTAAVIIDKVKFALSEDFAERQREPVAAA
ncbi:MAG: transketolase C-terminal domain-containing protein [Verrucomicrobiia bacterium]